MKTSNLFQINVLLNQEVSVTSVVFGGRRFKLPVVPANMQTIIDEKIGIMACRK